MQPRREKREELAAFQLIELHSIPASQGPDLQDIELARISQEVAERFYNLVAVGEGGRCPSRVKDGPILSQARSRSKGPLSDQVADATKPRGQCRSWVESRPQHRVPSDRFSPLGQRITLDPFSASVPAMCRCARKPSSGYSLAMRHAPIA